MSLQLLACFGCSLVLLTGRRFSLIPSFLTWILIACSLSLLSNSSLSSPTVKLYIPNQQQHPPNCAPNQPPTRTPCLSHCGRYDMCRRRKGGRCTKGTAGKFTVLLLEPISINIKLRCTKTPPTHTNIII